MRDYINLPEIGTFKDLIDDMPVKIWDSSNPAKVLSDESHQYNYTQYGMKYFNWFQSNGSGVVGFSPELHLNQVWIESSWIFMILK